MVHVLAAFSRVGSKVLMPRCFLTTVEVTGGWSMDFVGKSGANMNVRWQANED